MLPVHCAAILILDLEKLTVVQSTTTVKSNWKMFGTTTTGFGGTSSFGGFGSTAATANLGLGSQPNPMKDVEVSSPPDDSVSALKFSPSANFLIGSSWANDVSVVRGS